MANLKNTTINDTGNITLPVGTIAQRPASPANGMARVNTTLGCMEVFYNGNWKLYSLLDDAWNFCVTWIMVADGQSFHSLYAESITDITQISVQVIGVHATPILAYNNTDIRGSVRLHFGSLFLPNNSTTYTILFFKVVSGVNIQIGQSKVTTRNS